MPFDVPAGVDDGDGRYREVFRRGAFEHVTAAPNRTELRYEHDQNGPPYGFATELVEEPEMLVGRFRVAPSDLGDMLVALVRDDQLTGVSVGFIPGTDRKGSDADGPLVERIRVKRLKEVSLVGSPVHPGAKVLAVRSATDLDPGVVERETLYWWRLRSGLL